MRTRTIMMRPDRRLVALLLAVTVAAGASHAWSQTTGHRLFAVGSNLFLEERATQVVRPFEMWNTRLSNALFSTAFTNRVVAALDDYRRYGVNTVCVSVQGGEFGPAKNHLYPRSLNTDGTLDLTSPVWKNLGRILDETDRRGMVVNVLIWYHRRHVEVPDDQKAITATRAVATWLRATGHRNYFYDVVNEFDHYAFVLPGQTTKRPLFSTLQGALRLIYEVQQADPGPLVGVSPLTVLICPVGKLTSVTGQPWVEADIVYGHGPVVDPTNKAAYRLGVAPQYPLLKPFINNEFFYQLRYELTVQRDPRTNQLTYGHWDLTTTEAYVADLRLQRGFNGAPNVYSHHQQYAAPAALEPIAEIGPAGTQPEKTAGGGEPSMHWLFDAVAGIRRFGATPTFLDFNDGHAHGLEDRYAGTWQYVKQGLRQTDAKAAPAWARIAADDGDVEIAFDARFLADPGPTGGASVRVGHASPTGPAWALRLHRDRLVLDANGLAVTTISRTASPLDRYSLRLRGGRVRVGASGATLADVAGAPIGAYQNLLLVTDAATAAFDNVRVTAFRDTDFEDGKSGDWTSSAGTWSVITDPANAKNRVWSASVAAAQRGVAALDRGFEHVGFSAKVDLSGAPSATLRLRVADAKLAGSDGYGVTLTAKGAVSLERILGGKATELARASGTFDPKGFVVGIVAEGARIAVSIDGAAVLDVIDDAADAPRRGGLQVVAEPGTTRIDDLLVAAGPDRLPEATYRSTGPGLAAGSTLDFTDGDGLNDLAFLRLEVAPGVPVFIDLTLYLHPLFGVFDLGYAPDGRGYRFTVRQTIPVGSTAWQLRLTTRDRAGQSAVRTVTVR